MAKILLIEDDSKISSALAEHLRTERHVVDVVADGDDALHMLQSYQFEVIILDVGLPGISGFELCSRFREQGGMTPILMLTGHDTSVDKRKGLDSGADDYLTKPFDKGELSARVRALLRRQPTMLPPVLQVRNLRLDTMKACAFVDDQEVRLLPKEFALLEFLLRRKDQVFSLQSLLDHVWKADAQASPEAVRQTIARLRAKIDPDGAPSFITTVTGLGYTIEGE